MKTIKIKNISNKESFNQFNEELKNLCKKYSYQIVNNDLSNMTLVTIEWKPSRNFRGIKEQFLVNKEFWKDVYKCIIEKEVYFGEIEGKHSEIYGTITDEDITQNDDEDSINNFYNNHCLHFTNPHSFLRTLHDNILDNEGESETSLKIKKLIHSLIYS